MKFLEVKVWGGGWVSIQDFVIVVIRENPFEK